MKLGVLTSHAYPNQVQVATFLNELDREQVELVLTGGCSGGTAGLIVDTCMVLGIPVDWSHQDNEGVVNGSDLLIMFWDGVEQEPYGVLTMVERNKHPAICVYPDGTEERIV
jgi:hypothetical protein